MRIFSLHDITIILFFLLLVGACEESDPPVTHNTGKRSVLICNEGNFTFGNASLSWYDPDSMTVHNQVFFDTNLFPAGDVLQSISVRDTLAYLVINNSGKILVISTNSFRHLATIGGLKSPRYMHLLNNRKAYVSDLYSKSITIVDLNTHEVTGEIYVGASTEQIAQYGNALFVTSWSGNNKVYRVDTETDKIADSLTLTLQPNGIVLDRFNRLWVLSDGAYPGSPFGNEIPALTLIDPETLSILQTFTFEGPEYSPSRLSINSTGDTLFFLSGGWTGLPGESMGVFKMAVDAADLPVKPFIPQAKRLFYGLGIDPSNSEIYVTDAVDYLQRGWVYRYSPEGTLIDSFKVDITPSAFGFVAAD